MISDKAIGSDISHVKFLFLALGASLVSAFLSVVHLLRDRTIPTGRPRYGFHNNPALIAGIFLFVPLLTSIRVQTRSPCTTPLFPYIAANGTMRILARTQSNTGLVVIAESLNGPFRFMRCDQSLLGGRWLVDPNGEPAPGFNPKATAVGESIYSAFLLQEAVRLVERESPRAPQPPRVLNMQVNVFPLLSHLPTSNGYNPSTVD